MVISCVVGILFPGDNSEVSWLIIPVVVLSVEIGVEFIPVRQRNGVFEPFSNVVNPRLVNSDSSAPVIVISLARRVAAARDDPSPPVEPCLTEIIAFDDVVAHSDDSCFSG